MVSLLRTYQRICVVSAIIVLFMGTLFGLMQLRGINPTAPQPLTQTSIHSETVTVTNKGELEAWSNTAPSGCTDDFYVIPDTDIIGAYLYNFRTKQEGTSRYSFGVESGSFVVDISLNGVNISKDFTIVGKLKMSANNVSITSNFANGGLINNITLILTKFNASNINLVVQEGTFMWNNSKTTSLTLDGFSTALLAFDQITGDVTVKGDGIVTILNTTINGKLHESVKPTISCPTTYVVPYAFVFQPRATVDLKWNGSDNIRGPAYGLNYTLSVYKNGQFQENITGLTANTYPLSIDTAGSYTIILSCRDKQGNIATETITILAQADLLWFILMLIIIAAAVVGAIALFFWRKQRQWQKTALVEIPA